MKTLYTAKYYAHWDDTNHTFEVTANNMDDAMKEAIDYIVCNHDEADLIYVMSTSGLKLFYDADTHGSY